MTPKLQQAVERTYAAFAGVSRPKHIEACPCCLGTTEKCTLLSKRLREITADEMSGYASSVFLTVGSERDFHYFIPRILEILVTEPCWWPDPEVVGRALGTFGWGKFSEAEQEVLLEYFSAVIEDLLGAAEVDGYALDSWLCCSSHVVPAWTEYLWLVAKTPLALTALYEWHAKELARGTLANGFWQDSPRNAEFFDWIRGLVDSGEIQSAYGL